MVMEGFKEWWDKECDNGREIYPSSHNDCEDAWKAATDYKIESLNDDWKMRNGEVL